MNYQKFKEMIDTYTEEPNSINREWVELLREARDLFGCIEQLQAERDKAVEDMKLISQDGLCCICKFIGQCTDSDDCCFMWRGLEGSGE